MTEPTRPPAADPVLTAHGDPMDGFDVLLRASKRLSDGYYENVVLTVFNQLRKGRADDFVRDLVTESPVLDPRLVDDLVEGPTQPVADQRMLRAVLGAAREGRGDLSIDNLNRHLDAEILPELPELEAGHYLALRLDARKGFPGLPPRHWLTNHVLASAVHTTAASGAFADSVVANRAPSALTRDARATRALDRERSGLELEQAMRTAREAHAGLQLADAIDDRSAIDDQWVRRETALLKVKAAERALQTNSTEFDRSLGPRHHRRRERPRLSGDFGQRRPGGGPAGGPRP